jgi:hypothetical protein
MSRQANRLIIVALSTACLAAGEARADDLQNQIASTAWATRLDTYSFRRTITVESNLAKSKVFVEQFDPRRPSPDQWTIISVDGRAPTAKEIADRRKTTRDPFPPYYAIGRWFGAPATRSETTPGYVTYQFASLPPGTLKFGQHDASPDTQAEALVNVQGNTPFIERLNMTATRGFKMMLVASLGSMTFTMRYRQLPDGHVVPVDALSDIGGSAMGKAGQIHTVASFSDFAATR